MKKENKIYLGIAIVLLILIVGPKLGLFSIVGDPSQIFCNDKNGEFRVITPQFSQEYAVCRFIHGNGYDECNSWDFYCKCQDKNISNAFCNETAYLKAQSCTLSCETGGCTHNTDCPSNFPLCENNKCVLARQDVTICQEGAISECSLNNQSGTQTCNNNSWGSCVVENKIITSDFWSHEYLNINGFSVTGTILVIIGGIIIFLLFIFVILK